MIEIIYNQKKHESEKIEDYQAYFWFNCKERMLEKWGREEKERR